MYSLDSEHRSISPKLGTQSRHIEEVLAVCAIYEKKNSVLSIIITISDLKWNIELKKRYLKYANAHNQLKPPISWLFYRINFQKLKVGNILVCARY